MSTTQRSLALAPGGFELVKSKGGIEEYRLQTNGLTLLFMPVSGAPVALLMLTYLVGGRDESPGVYGGSHMLEHLMFKGTQRFHKQHGTSIHDLLAAVGGHVNATTWLDHTNYFSLVPSSHWRLAAEIEADRMRGMLALPADLEAEREVVLNEYDQYASSPFERLNRAVWAAAYSGDPYARPVIGTRQDIVGFTREALLGHYERYYWPSNATLTLMGDVEREDALVTIASLFSGIPRGSRPPMKAESAMQGGSGRRVEVTQPGAPSCLVLAFRAPAGLDVDTEALMLLGIILAGGRASRLHHKLVLSGYASEVWASVARARAGSLFQVEMLLAGGGDSKQAERCAREAIDELRRDGVTSAELGRAKATARARLLTSRDGPLEMAMQLNDAIAIGDWTHYVCAAERIDTVSRADLQRVAGRFLVDAWLTVGSLAASQDGA